MIAPNPTPQPAGDKPAEVPSVISVRAATNEFLDVSRQGCMSWFRNLESVQRLCEQGKTIEGMEDVSAETLLALRHQLIEVRERCNRLLAKQGIGLNATEPAP